MGPDHLKEKHACQDAARLPESRGRHKRPYLTEENPFVKHKDVAGTSRERSIYGVDDYLENKYLCIGEIEQK